MSFPNERVFGKLMMNGHPMLHLRQIPLHKFAELSCIQNLSLKFSFQSLNAKYSTVHDISILIIKDKRTSAEDLNLSPFSLHNYVHDPSISHNSNMLDRDKECRHIKHTLQFNVWSIIFSFTSEAKVRAVTHMLQFYL